MKLLILLALIIGLIKIQSSRCEDPECEDLKPVKKCEKWKNKGRCDEEKIMYRCPKTCGKCGYPDEPTTTMEGYPTIAPPTTATTTAVATTNDDECKDEFPADLCLIIKQLGSCSQDLAKSICKKTCDHCEDEEEETTTETVTTTATPEKCCSRGFLDTYPQLNWHGDLCRNTDGSYSCPPGCDRIPSPGPYCKMSGTSSSPCRVVAGETCILDCPVGSTLDAYPNLGWHGDVCRDQNGGWSCPTGCQYSSGNPSLPGVAPYCVNEGTTSPCRV